MTKKAREYIDELNELVRRFKKRPERWESDCAMTERILELHQAGGDKRRARIVCWALKTLAKERVSPIAKGKLVTFLTQVRSELSEKQQARFQDRTQAFQQEGTFGGKKKAIKPS